MTFPFFRYNFNQATPQEPPFTAIVTHQDISRQGTWRPEALVMFAKSLRTSGFLLALPPEDLKCFLLLLTFLMPNGQCAASLEQLATGLRISKNKTRIRYERLALFRWLGQPVIFWHKTDNGMEMLVLATGFLPLSEEKPDCPTSQPVIKAVPPGVIIEHSRRTYARPRAEVERQIADLNGWRTPETNASSGTQPGEVESPQATVRRELIKEGVLPEQADNLLAHFDLVRIQRQLMWLPYRRVRNRAGFLLAAVKDNYEGPQNLQRPITIPTNEPDSHNG